jgi:hypothetical protein
LWPATTLKGTLWWVRINIGHEQVWVCRSCNDTHTAINLLYLTLTPAISEATSSKQTDQLYSIWMINHFVAVLCIFLPKEIQKIINTYLAPKL